MAANQPPSFRLPFALGEDVHPQVAAGLRYLFNGHLDLNSAIAALAPKVAANTAGVTNVTNNITSTGGGGGGTPAPTLGGVNPQTGTSYTTQQSDYGGLILIESAVAFALTLNSALIVPYFVTIYNFGAGVATLTPGPLGQVNGNASVRLLPNQFAIVFYDGANFWALITISTVGLPIFANNAAAITGGLVAGDLYLTGSDPDFAAVVH